MLELDTLDVSVDHGVLYATLNQPPLNLIGPEMVRDLVTLVLYLESHPEVAVIVFGSASPHFFCAHVDMTRAAELGPELARLEPGAPLGLLYRRISALNQVSIAAVTGRVRGAGSELVLACDMRFAGDGALFGQPEVGLGAIPGAGAVQHLTRLMGRGRALEALVGADDFSADLAERYGWINRALPEDELPAFVSALARRIARFPSSGVADAKRRVNAIALPGVDALRDDSQLFLRGLARPEVKARTALLFERGMQTDGAVEAGFGLALADLPD